MKEIVWLEPTADEGVVYMLRAPHDNAVVAPVVNGLLIAKLPAESYVAVKLPTGTHTLTAVKDDARGSRVSTLTFEIGRFHASCLVPPAARHRRRLAGTWRPDRRSKVLQLLIAHRAKRAVNKTPPSSYASPLTAASCLPSAARRQDQSERIGSTPFGAALTVLTHTSRLSSADGGQSARITRRAGMRG
ncbi:hypothetical protein [Variovorax guangxiensis]|uniref:hypothetical protein n=1 Tax=Variovorax guangxiensis TaxID=1775474 RepID=UPI00285AE030|nr:hypothetical protein [Variovorax guangxiensis]MDR6861012.1 hypothetical protein [Variovorax guangxiensis]